MSSQDALREELRKQEIQAADALKQAQGLKQEIEKTELLLQQDRALVGNGPGTQKRPGAVSHSPTIQPTNSHLHAPRSQNILRLMYFFGFAFRSASTESTCVTTLRRSL